jgi:hypothetical protein
MDYDVSRAFERIENELLESMIRNLKKHKAEETEMGFEWTQWQAVQLEELQRFKQEAAKKYGLEFKSMNQKIRETIAEAMMQGASDEEVNVLKAIEKGLVLNREQGLSAGFFQANQKRLDALMNAVEHDMKTAQTAVLRYTNDQYRKIIFQSQVAASSGALTYEKAVDMATSDFLKKGINCITYSNGAIHNIASYADMAVRTASKRAYLMGEGQKRQEWGISTVILNKRFNACPLCMPFEGKVLIDDVWSGGTSKDGPYPLMSSAMAAGLYHPNCKDKHSTYFEGISSKPESRYYEEKPVIKGRQLIENKLNHAKRQSKSYNRLANNSLDADNQETYRARATEWRDKVKGYREQLNLFEASNGLELDDTFETETKKFKRRQYLPKEYNKVASSEEYANAIKEYRKETRKSFESGTNIGKRILLKYGDVSDNAFATLIEQKDVRYANSKIYLNIFASLADERGVSTSYFHELGHQIDEKLGWKFKNDVLIKKKLEEDLINLNINNIIIDINNNPKASSVSDIIGGITKNHIRGKYGHSTYYWNIKGNLESEFFAHTFEAQFDKERRSFLENTFPSAYNYVINILERSGV